MGRRKKILSDEEIKAKEQKELEKKSGMKKRGRKPKNKMPEVIEISKPKSLDTNIVYQNIILHLKCKKNDIQKNINNKKTNNILEYNPEINVVQPFNNNDNYCNLLNNNENISPKCPYAANDIINNNNYNTDTNDNAINEEDQKMNENKVIHQKLCELEQNLHYNNINKKSNCFWCTYDFDNPVIYIPKSIKNESYHVYGNFCSPECACSYLFNQHIDDAKKFERYQLLNYMYCNIYDYKKNIKLAPDPFYTLEKYMGNLSIQEYRKLLQNERLLILIDKPLTKIFPELHEDNNEFDVGLSNKYSLKKTHNKIKKNTSIQKLFKNQ